MIHQIVFISKKQRINQVIEMRHLLKLIQNPVAFTQYHLKGLALNVTRVEIKQCDEVAARGGVEVWTTVLELDIEHGLQTEALVELKQLQVQYDDLEASFKAAGDVYDEHIARLEFEIIKLEGVVTDDGEPVVNPLRNYLLLALNRLSAIVPNQELAGMLHTEIPVLAGIAENTPIQCGHVMYKGMNTSPLGILNGMFEDGDGIAMVLNTSGDMFIPHVVPVLPVTPTTEYVPPANKQVAPPPLPTMPIAPIRDATDTGANLLIQLNDEAIALGKLEQWRINGWTDTQLVNHNWATRVAAPAAPAPAVCTIEGCKGECENK